MCIHKICWQLVTWPCCLDPVLPASLFTLWFFLQPFAAEWLKCCSVARCSALIAKMVSMDNKLLSWRSGHAEFSYRVLGSWQWCHGWKLELTSPVFQQMCQRWRRNVTKMKTFFHSQTEDLIWFSLCCPATDHFMKYNNVYSWSKHFIANISTVYSCACCFT